MDLIEPKSFILPKSGEFIISKLPCLAGREIMVRYPVSFIPKVGNYEVNEEMALKLFKYVEKVTPQRNIRLTDATLVDQHIKPGGDVWLLEWEMIKYNFDFLTDGTASAFLQSWQAKAENKATKILTNLLDMWLKRNSRRTTSSKLSIQ